MVLLSCSPDILTNNYPNSKILEETEVVEIPLTGKIAERKSEISGLCWYKDNLILLPQYPDRYSENGLGKIFFIKKQQIDNYLNGDKKSSLATDFFTIDLKDFSNLFQIGSGFEAVTTNNDTVYFSIESLNNGETETFLIMGIIDPLLKKISLNKNSLTLVNSKLHIHNLSDETILYYRNKIIPIYEANGDAINPKPVVSIYDKSLHFVKEIEFPHIEYRITDATSADKDGKFWAINYLYPGDIKKLKMDKDLLIEKYGIGKSHIKSKAVERLVEFQYTDSGIKLLEKPPLYFTLLKNDSRNWEGLARYNGKIKGFLVATDTFPKTILAFVKGQ